MKCLWWADGQHLFEIGSSDIYGGFRKAESPYDHVSLKGCRCGEVVELSGAKRPKSLPIRTPAKDGA